MTKGIARTLWGSAHSSWRNKRGTREENWVFFTRDWHFTDDGRGAEVTIDLMLQAKVDDQAVACSWLVNCGLLSLQSLCVAPVRCHSPTSLYVVPFWTLSSVRQPKSSSTASLRSRCPPYGPSTRQLLWLNVARYHALLARNRSCSWRDFRRSGSHEDQCRSTRKLLCQSPTI